jgi:Uma2 family endonuclease
VATQPHSKIPVSEYLALELRTHEKHEYLDGEVFAMTGASGPHNLIVTNVVSELRQQLKKRPCVVYPSDLRVKVSSTGLYTYPDAIVVCDKPQFEQPGDTLLNPTVIVEVLSESTELYDRGKKFEHYRTLASLKDYILIDQLVTKVELYSRQPQQRWLLSEANRLTDSISIPSIDCVLSLSEIYDKVELAASH